MRRRHVDKHVSKPGRGTGWDTQHDLKPAKIQYAFHIFLHKALDRERGRCQPMGYRIAVPNVHALRASNSSAQHKNSGIKLLPSIDPTWASLCRSAPAYPMVSFSSRRSLMSRHLPERTQQLQLLSASVALPPHRASASAAPPRRCFTASAFGRRVSEGAGGEARRRQHAQQAADEHVFSGPL